MGEMGTIFQNAILCVAGNEGLEKFNRAGYDTGTRKIMHPDGSLDLPQLMNILLDVFPEEQASAITDNVLVKYVEMASEEQKQAQVAVEDKRVEIEPGADDEPYEDNLAKYLATDASDVRDLINEARRIRLAMGKPVLTKAAMPPEPIYQEPVQAAPAERPPVHADPKKPSISIVAPIVPKKEEPAPLELSHESLESEIRRLVAAKKAYTSVDIMDFIRYLKDKGYHFQENIVLENVYTWLDERKSQERAALMADIHGFLERLPWPSENEVSAFIEQKKCDGVVCESSEIKRMILVEMIRKH